MQKNKKKEQKKYGRNVRYEFFNEILEKTNSNKIATAHNSNDRAETVILNILRGSGLSGLKGIEPNREGKYIRPLININRDDIEKYCEENNLKPKYDESNNENIYSRNKVRNEIIPYIKKEFNPNIIKTINRLSDVATEENEYLQEELRKKKITKIEEKHIDTEILKEIKEYCENKLSRYSWPSEYEFRSELPKTLVGKIAYTKLEEEERGKNEKK